MKCQYTEYQREFLKRDLYGLFLKFLLVFLNSDFFHTSVFISNLLLNTLKKWWTDSFLYLFKKSLMLICQKWFITVENLGENALRGHTQDFLHLRSHSAFQRLCPVSRIQVFITCAKLHFTCFSKYCDKNIWSFNFVIIDTWSLKIKLPNI